MGPMIILTLAESFGFFLAIALGAASVLAGTLFGLQRLEVAAIVTRPRGAASWAGGPRSTGGAGAGYRGA